MSNYQRDKGKIKLLSRGNLEWACEMEYLNIKGEKLESLDVIEDFMDEFYDEYLIYKDCLFKIVEHKASEGGDFQSLIELDKDEYAFDMYYYNGGTCMTEILEEELRKTNRYEIG